MHGQSEKPTLVVGAGGKTGRRVVERLLAKGAPVRAASRSGDTSFDWQDPSTWAAAVSGVESAYITYYPDLALPGAADTVGSFARLAVSSGVQRLVLLSGRGEAGAQAAEELVKQSGADWTIVRCAFFNQNFSETFGDAVRHGVVALPAGDTPEPFLDADDIAEVVVASLTDRRHVGQVYELTGPRLMTLADAASELGQAMGRKVEYVSLTAAEFAQALANEGVPEVAAAQLADLLAEVLDGRNSYLTDGVGRALGRPPRDFADFAADAVANGAFHLEGAAA